MTERIEMNTIEVAKENLLNIGRDGKEKAVSSTLKFMYVFKRPGNCRRRR